MAQKLGFILTKAFDAS